MPSRRSLWLTPDRLFYVGLIGAPSMRTMGSINLYVASQGSIRLRLPGGDWQCGELAVLPAYVPHQLCSEERLIHALQIEAETVAPTALPALLRHCGLLQSPEFVARVRRQAQMQAAGLGQELDAPDFDVLFFGGALPPRALQPRIRAVVEAIKREPSAMLSAEDGARSVGLSISRFLHLFRQAVGVPFRGFRSWKRARSLLHYVNRDANLARVAQDTGYPDSSHFSHAIRQVCRLKPSDILACSRWLSIYASQPA